MIAVKGNEMKKIDAYTIEKMGIPGIVLMENAAQAFVKELLDDITGQENIFVFCGTGNNGGDGFAIARLLYQKNIQVTVVLLGNLEKIKGDAKINYDILTKLDIQQIKINNEASLEQLDHIMNPYSIYVDAIFGTGLERDIESIHYHVIEKINKSKGKTYSVDVPSGIHADHGGVMGIAIKACKTITFCLPKIGLFVGFGFLYSGDVIVVDIGIPTESLKTFQFSYELIDDSYKKMIPKRYIRSHKGTYGKVLSITGSKDMMGAAMLSTLAAYKTGSGLVNVLTELGNESTIFQIIPEAIVSTYTKDEDLFSEQIGTIIELMDKSDVILIGPGIGQNYYTKRLLEITLSLQDKKIIIDADGLNIIANDLSILENHQNDIIVTPHLGEMSRLTGYTIEEISKAPFSFAEAFSKRYGVITILKSHRTIVVDQQMKYINVFGNSGMATAGSGDVLAGIIASLVGQGATTLQAAVTGVYVHSKAGDLAENEYGEYGMVARDIISAIPKVMR